MIEGIAGNMSIKMNIMADRFTKKDFKKGMFMDDKKIDEITPHCQIY